MSAFNQAPYSPSPSANGTGPPTPSQQPHQSRPSTSNSAQTSRMHHDRQNGAMPIQRPYQAMQGESGMPLRMAASPPKNKNTQHVPCKFFLQGQCQAGQMCPFSHDIESTTRPAPCKYFAKGGCKFGRKCALLHITQDGTVVNRMPMAPPAQYFPPQHPSAFGQPPAPPGLLSMQAQGLESRPNGDGPQPDFEHYQYASRNGYDGHSIDMTYTSASPKYGSPQNDRIATSPPQKGLSVLDAPLPNSFDSNGVSYAARNGPFAASVPSKWDFESPPSSLPRMAHLSNTALRDLHNSAYPERGINNVINTSMGSSPPSGNDEPLVFEKRPLHSDRLRGSRAIMSASLGTRPPIHFEDSEDDVGDTDEEKELLPSSLHDLIPEGLSRRDSKPRNNEDHKPASFLAAQRRTISNQGTPSDSKANTPFSSSPSRYSNMFARSAMRDGVGHVGSPLRDSSFPTFGSTPTNGDLSPSVSSPPRQASMSMLTQELQRTKLDAARSVSGQQAPVPSRTLSNGSNGRASMDRALSSNSVAQRIEEDQEVFDMDFEPKSNTNGGFGPVGGGRTAK